VLAGREEIEEFEMTKSRGIGRGGARPGSGRKRKAITLRLAALKNALAALQSTDVSNFREADRRFVRAMIALGATNNATAVAFGISEVELLAKFPDELECRAGETIQLTSPSRSREEPAGWQRFKPAGRGISDVRGNPRHEECGRSPHCFQLLLRQ
jgi:hypothetical protein